METMETPKRARKAEAVETEEALKIVQVVKAAEAAETGELFLEYLRLKHSAEKLSKELTAVAMKLDGLFDRLDGDSLGTTIGTIRRVRDSAGRSGWVVVTGDQVQCP